jgi:large repetitive protein
VSYSTFQMNTATQNGGALFASGDIYSAGNRLTLEFSTFEGNRAGNGGAIFAGQPGTVRVKESKIRMNTAAIGPDVSGSFISEGGNEIGNAAGSTGFMNGVLSDRIGTN